MLMQMARNNIGSLVVLKPEGQHIAGIVTERGKSNAKQFQKHGLKNLNLSRTLISKH